LFSKKPGLNPNFSVSSAELRVVVGRYEATSRIPIMFSTYETYLSLVPLSIAKPRAPIVRAAVSLQPSAADG
jgi:hypothetical protein